MSIMWIALVIVGAVIAWFMTRWLTAKFGDGTAASKGGRPFRAKTEHEAELLTPATGNSSDIVAGGFGGGRLAQPGLAEGVIYYDSKGRAAVNRMVH